MSQHFPRFLPTLLAIFLIVTAWASTAQALLVNPTAPPPAGQAATPLDTSSSTQRKLGSLVIGSKAYIATNSAPKLCLNATDQNDAVNCITTWQDVATIGSSANVQLHTDLFSLATPYTGYDAPQIGYVRIKGSDGPNYPQTLQVATPVNPGSLNGLTALYAQGNNIDNAAGYFTGSIDIEHPSGAAASLGSLCLNGTATPSDGSQASLKGYYCISQWTDVRAPVLSDKLALQNANALTAQSGNSRLTQAYSAATFVLGDPTGLPVALSCGDGICAGNESASSSSPNYCAVDCDTIPAPSTIIGAYSSGTVTLTVQSTNQSATASNVYLLLVRSTDPNFVFSPQDGATYSQTTSGSPIIVGMYQVAAGGGKNFTDTPTGYGGGTKLYYRAYQANLYPRYSLTYLPYTVTIPSGGGGTSGCFVANSMVDTPLGQTAIQDLHVGDAVYSYDQASGRTVISRVERTYIHDDQQYGQVVFSDGSAVRVTSIHPFYDARQKTWREIGTMHRGDEVLQWTKSGYRILTITSLEFTSGRGRVYNIEVANYHNYFVHGIVVHNKGVGGG